MDISNAEIKGTATVGASVKVEGYYDENGVFIVTKIEFESNGSDSGSSDDNGDDDNDNDSNDDSNDDNSNNNDNDNNNESNSNYDNSGGGDE